MEKLKNRTGGGNDALAFDERPSVEAEEVPVTTIEKADFQTLCETISTIASSYFHSSFLIKVSESLVNSHVSRLINNYNTSS